MRVCNVDLRDWLATMTQRGDVVEVDAPVDTDQEMATIAYLLARTPASPVVHFTSPTIQAGQVAANRTGVSHLWNLIGGSWPRLATTFGLPPDTHPVDCARHVARRLDSRIAPVLLPRSDAPVLGHTETGPDLDLDAWPIPRQWPRDGGRYGGTHDVVVSRRHDGPMNLGTYRMMVQSATETGVMIFPGSGSDGARNLRTAWEHDQPLDIVAAWGIHPLYVAVGGANFPPEVSEYDQLGGLVGAPVATTTAPLTGLAIPAYAEFVIEGQIAPGAYRDEGPFGEFTGYYSDMAERYPLVTVKAIHHRSDPILTNALDSFPPSNEELALGATMRAAKIWRELEACGLQGVAGVYCPPSSAAGYGMTIVALRQLYAGHAKQALALAGNVQGGALFTKWIIVVDDDIDPANLDEVVWAMGTRCPPNKRIMIQDGTWNFQLDPAIDPEGPRNIGSRAFIDATRDFNYGRKYRETRLRRSTYDQVVRRWTQELGLPGTPPDVRSFDDPD